MDAIGEPTILPAEQEIVAATERGDWAELSGKSDDDRRVRAAFLRALLLGLPVMPDGETTGVCRVQLPGVRIRGALIEETLDLADCAGGEGGGLPGLAMEDCNFGASIDVTNARLARFSIKNSRIGEVRMRGVRLDGPFNFSGVRPKADAPDAPAWIDAHGCTIRGEVVGDGAKLLAPAKREKVPLGEARYALRLSDAKIGGNLNLLGNFGAIGGVTIAGARISENIYGVDAVMEAGEQSALRAQAAQIDGVMLLDGLTARGEVWLFGAKVGGTLQCAGACLANRTKDGSGNALLAINAEIGGSVLLRDGFAAEGCVSLSGAKIGRDLDCGAAQLANCTEDGDGTALLAHNTEVGGDVVLGNGSIVEGCVYLCGARIGGNLECDSAHLSNHTDDGNGDALLAEGAQISGAVHLRDSFRAEGRASLLLAKIGSNLECNGAHLANQTSLGLGEALVADGAEIGGTVYLCDGFVADGCVSLHSATIGGTLTCDGAHLANRTGSGFGAALLGYGAQIGGSILLRNGFTAEGRVSFSAAKVRGNVECDGAHFANPTEDCSWEALAMEGSEIGGSMLLRNGFTAEGRISLLNAKIGALTCDSAMLRNGGGWAAATLNLTSTTIERDVRLGAASVGSIWLWGCRVGGNLDCSGATFAAWPADAANALNAVNVTVGGDVILDDATVLGQLMFEHAEITGGLRWDGIRFPQSVPLRLPTLREAELSWQDAIWSYSGPVEAATVNPGPLPTAGTDANPAARIVLAHARIGAALQAHDLTAEVPLLIDLSAAQTYTLDDVKNGDTESFPAGWGRAGRPGFHLPRLDLDGFVYQRIEHFPAAQPAEVHRLWRWLFQLLQWIGVMLAPVGRLLMPLRDTPLGLAAKRFWAALCKWASGGEDIAGPRLDWLRRQHSTRDGAFFPQPYRHLATVLRAQGHVEAARAVAIAEQDETPYGFGRPFRRFFFGRCFGYGLSPRRATVTLAATLLLGTALVWQAWTSQVLVLPPGRQNIANTQQHLATEHVAASEQLCGPYEISPLFYAMDMMLPVIPLHQEDRCEVAARPGTWWWQVAWAVFSILGKIVASLALITYSGVLKPKDE